MLEATSLLKVSFVERTAGCATWLGLAEQRTEAILLFVTRRVAQTFCANADVDVLETVDIVYVRPRVQL